MTTNEAVSRLTARNTDIDLWPYLLKEGGALDVDNCPDCWERDAHIERYLFACRVLSNMRVLDYGCGVGYGSEILWGRGANEVTGYDPSSEAIAACYRNRRQFVKLMFTDKLWGWDPFDGCIAFEVIEHMDDAESFVDSVPARHLVCSVPIIPTVGQNPHHKHDFTDESFRRLVERRFDIRWWFHQYRPFANVPCVMVIHGEAR